MWRSYPEFYLVTLLNDDGSFAGRQRTVRLLDVPADHVCGRKGLFAFVMLTLEIFTKITGQSVLARHSTNIFASSLPSVCSYPGFAP